MTKSRSSGGRADWSGIVEALAVEYADRAGKTIRREGDRLRIGNRGSLAVWLESGHWHDFETGNGGGALAWLIAFEGAADNADAARMLRDRGLLDGDGVPYAHKSGDNPPNATKRNVSGLYGQPKPPVPAETGPNPDKPASEDARRKRNQAGRIWLAAAALKLDADIPGAAYLRERFRIAGSAGDADGILRPDWRGGLPDSIRWLDLAAWPRSGPRPPGGAAGCLLFRWTDSAGDGRGVSAMAIDAGGRRIEWGGKARMIGARRGLLHVVREPGDGGRWHVVEGELSALALTCWPPTAEVFGNADGIAAAGSAGRLAEAVNLVSGPATVWAESDSGGLDAADAARRSRDGVKVIYCRRIIDKPAADPLDAVLAVYRRRGGD